jgi:hypothetical protein
MSLAFFEQTKLPIGGLIDLEDLPADKNQEFRWCFELGKPLVKPKLVNKLPTKMRRFHDWYLKKSAEGLEMFGMLVRPGDFSLQNEKVVWLQFADIYEILPSGRPEHRSYDGLMSVSDIFSYVYK